MASTTLVRLATRVDKDLSELCGAAQGRLKEARSRLLYMLLTAGPADELLSRMNGDAVRGLRTHVHALAEHLANRSALPEALCAHYRYQQSCNRVLDYYRVRQADWQYVHRLARQCGAELEALTATVPYERLDWHDELERRLVRVQMVLDPRALDDILVCALEAYLSPRRRKGYEVYGITLGMYRDAPETRKGAGTMITRFVSVARAQPQLSAEAGPRHVEPNLRSLDAVTRAAATLFPQHQLIGDFHSHVFADLATLRSLKGWEPSEWDADFSTQWIDKMRDLGHNPQVDLVVGIARCGRRTQRSHYKGLPHTLQASVGDCRFVIGAARILASGRYTRDGLSLSTPGLAD